MPDRTGRRSGDMAERGGREGRAVLGAQARRGARVRHAGGPAGPLPPGALPAGRPVSLDSSLRRYGTVYPAAGETNNMFRTTPDDLLRVSGAVEGGLAGTEGR